MKLTSTKPLIFTNKHYIDLKTNFFKNSLVKLLSKVCYCFNDTLFENSTRRVLKEIYNLPTSYEVLEL